MTEGIAARLVALCDGKAVLYLSEAESDTFPYAVYEADYTPSYNKDGVYRISADVTIHCYGKTFSEADTLATTVKGLIDTGMAGDGYSYKEEGKAKNCSEGIWAVDLRYTMIQR